VGFRKHDNEPWDSIKRGKFIDYVRIYLTYIEELFLMELLIRIIEVTDM